MSAPKPVNPIAGLNPGNREKLYLGHLTKMRRGVFEISGNEQFFIVRAGMDNAKFREILPYFAQGKNLLRNERDEFIDIFFTNYMKPVIESLERQEIDKAMLVRPGDNHHTIAYPSVCKSRPAFEAGLSALMQLHFIRHFKPVYMARKHDIAFADKEPTLMWRGATTGEFRIKPGSPLGSRSYVPALMDRIKHRGDMDIAFSKIVQLPPDRAEHMREHYFAPRIDIREQVKFRYLLSLEGNDTASGLKWMLATNSCIIMPHITIMTWACENMLRPYVHYVPVRYDLADLEEVFDWCLQNEGKCEEIAQNGKAFIEMFENPKVEQGIGDKIVRFITNRSRVLKAVGSDIPDDLFD
ncbi:MAG: glycosyl transferase family 90 [Pseudomonadota bacterium]